jgi:hypothetical protein
MGLMPHTNPRKMFASDYYAKEFLRFNQRLGSEGLEFKSFLPRLYLPVLLQKAGIPDECDGVLTGAESGNGAEQRIRHLQTNGLAQ